MEIPTSNTPVAKCLALATYSCQMMSIYTKTNPTLPELASKMEEARDTLEMAEDAYAEAEANMLPARVKVTLADYEADEGIKQAKRAAELADGEANGPLVTHLFPQGTTPLVRPFGWTQVQEMIDLEGRYEGLLSRWPEAQSEKGKVTALRQQYENALNARKNAAQIVHDLRASRDLAKEDFLDVYAEVANRVRAMFPRNKKKQDLFFDTVTERGNAENDDEKAVA